MIPEDSISLTHGIRYVVRDMGNGVHRVLSSEMVPLDALKAEANTGGRYHVPFPPPSWLRDIGIAALEATGVEPSPTPRNRIAVEVFIRPIDDDTIEVIGWRVGLIGGSGGIRTHGT